METLLKDFKARDQKILFFNLKPSVCAVFEGVDIDYRVFYNFEDMERCIEETKPNSTSITAISPAGNITTAESA